MINRLALLAALAFMFATASACGLKVNEKETERLDEVENCVEEEDNIDPQTGQSCDMEHAEGVEAGATE